MPELRPNSTRLVPIGVVGRPHGLSGEVKVFVQRPFLEWFWTNAPKTFDRCVVGPSIFAISSAKRVGKQGALALEGLQTFEAAKSLQGKPFEVPGEFFGLVPLASRALAANLIGFRLYQKVDGRLEWFGTINRYDAGAGAVGLYEVDLATGDSMLVPADEETLSSVDEVSKSAQIDRPERYLTYKKRSPSAPTNRL